MRFSQILEMFVVSRQRKRNQNAFIEILHVCHSRDCMHLLLSNVDGIWIMFIVIVDIANFNLKFQKINLQIFSLAAS